MVRPDYNQLNPVSEYISENHYQIGNPDLLPSRSYTLTWSNTIFRMVNLSVWADFTDRLFSTIIRDAGNGITESIPLNAFDYRGIGHSLSISYHFFNYKLYGNVATYYTYGKYRNPREGFVFPEGRSEREYFSVDASVGYSITDRLRISLRGSYVGKNTDIQSDSEANFYANAFVTYTFLKNKRLSVSLDGMDIFNSGWKNRTTSYFDGNVRFSKFTSSNTQQIGIRVYYTFRGGKDMRRQVTRDVNEEDKRFSEQ